MQDQQPTPDELVVAKLSKIGAFDGVPFVTIDGPSTMDIDDAIYVETVVNEGFRILIAIADPTNLVKPGSTEDESARLLGATAYARDVAYNKMLPARISEAGASLVAGQTRAAMVMDIRLSASLEVSGFDVTMTKIVVQRRLTYEDIPRILEDETNDLRPMLSLASSLSRHLMTKRRQSGALALYDLARMVLTDEDGKLIQLHSVDEVIGHIVIQEMMVLANTSLATWMVDNDIPAIFRNHVPKLAAPSSREMAETIETWLVTGALDVENARERFFAVAGKATYAATVKGHYALAVPVYLHGTSPLRRYADLVNVRQVKAFKARRPFEYTVEQLEPLAVQVTESAERRKEERSQGFKDSVIRTADRALQSQRLHHLADHEIVQAIKLASAAGGLPDALVDELVRRLDGSIVTDKVTDRLLEELPPALWSESLKEAFGRWLHAVPTRAMHVLLHGEQIGFFQKVTVAATGEGTSFQGLATVITRDGDEIQGLGTSGRKRDAEQEAAVRAVANFLGIESANRTLQSAPVPTPVKGNPKGALLELCTKQSWPAPVYEIRGQGPSHMMIFSGTATLAAGPRRFVATTDRGANKKDAEATLSSDLLAQVRQFLGHSSGPKKQASPSAPAARPDASSPASAPAAPAGSTAPVTFFQGEGPVTGNPIGQLMEMAAKKKVRAPEFVVETIGLVPPLFRVTCKSFVGGERLSAGQASTKQEAKARAAQAALASLATT